MDPQERASRLSDMISQERISHAEVLQELQALTLICETDYQREKIADARRWANIYFSPRKWRRWGSREDVRSFLLQDIYRFEMSFRTIAP